jgi:hypothetical protein
MCSLASARHCRRPERHWPSPREPSGAKVSINGRSVGRTPVRLPGLPAAAVRVRVSLRGHLEFDQTVTLSVEGTTSVDARLMPAPSHTVQFSLSSALAFRTGAPRLVDRWSTHYATSGLSRWEAYVTASLDAQLDGAYAGPSSATLPVLSAQAQLTDRLGVGIAVESVSRELAGDIAFKCSVARQATYYGQSTASTRTAEEAGAVSGLVSRQRAVHVAAIWSVHLTRRLALEFSAGPSVLHIAQDVPGDTVTFTHCASGGGGSWPSSPVARSPARGARSDAFAWESTQVSPQSCASIARSA